MALDLKKMDTLKEKLVNCKDFREAFNYFFDHFGENDQFLDMGQEVEYSELKQVLAKVGQLTIANHNANPSMFLIIKLKKHNFYHGAYFLDSRLVNFIFFKDIDKGMIAVASSPDSKRVLFARFSLAQFKGDFSKITLN